MGQAGWSALWLSLQVAGVATLIVALQERTLSPHAAAREIGEHLLDGRPDPGDPPEAGLEGDGPAPLRKGDRPREEPRGRERLRTVAVAISRSELGAALRGSEAVPRPTL